MAGQADLIVLIRILIVYNLVFNDGFAVVVACEIANYCVYWRLMRIDGTAFLAILNGRVTLLHALQCVLFEVCFDFNCAAALHRGGVDGRAKGFGLLLRLLIDSAYIKHP